MITETFHLILISPSKIMFEGETTLAEIPGSEGEFGVLPGHAPFFAMLKEGVITVHTADKSIRRFTVGAGYAEVSPEGCTILSEQIEAA